MPPPPAQTEFPVIALVASAGGIEPLKRVTQHVPSDLAAAMIVLLHLDPTRESHLVEIIGRRSALPTVTVEVGMDLLAGRVHVAPPGFHVLVTADGRVSLIESGPPPPHRPSADLLLATLAIAMGPRAICVVLSGQGHDGATGATAIHKFGGTVLASDEGSSVVFAMPSATIERNQAVDHVLDVDDIPALLAALVSAALLDDRPER
jgi:two-component system chemotaxis response regulator CheB